AQIGEALTSAFGLAGGQDPASFQQPQNPAEGEIPRKQPQHPAATPPARGDVAQPKTDAVQNRPAAHRSSPARSTNRAGAASVGPRTPAAVLHTDGLWLPDGTTVQLSDPLIHVGAGRRAGLQVQHRLSAVCDVG
ncbi:MAG TPA: hypothetical protein VMU34_11620, partial [Mycobacterium sp.]|nr:hypothetical protein [Mycobacterium sp.]